MYCKFDHSEMIFGPFEKMTFFGEHPLHPASSIIILIILLNNIEKTKEEGGHIYYFYY